MGVFVLMNKTIWTQSVFHLTRLFSWPPQVTCLAKSIRAREELSTGGRGRPVFFFFPVEGEGVGNKFEELNYPETGRLMQTKNLVLQQNLGPVKECKKKLTNILY